MISHQQDLSNNHKKKTGIYQSHLILYFYLSYLPGLNRRPPPYQGDALPTELKQQATEFWVKKKNSASRTRTYDIMINSHALLPTELLRNIEKRGNVLPSQGETPNYYRR